ADGAETEKRDPHLRGPGPVVKRSDLGAGTQFPVVEQETRGAVADDPQGFDDVGAGLFLFHALRFRLCSAAYNDDLEERTYFVLQ
ncbi:MAG: hypothetical protein HW396_559, partial [Candidatus Dadabacteria bacterium]|nr:hypothetical protein [Candidatus Dadabacteria bacterium]